MAALETRATNGLLRVVKHKIILAQCFIAGQLIGMMFIICSSVETLDLRPPITRGQLHRSRGRWRGRANESNPDCCNISSFSSITLSWKKFLLKFLKVIKKKYRLCLLTSLYVRACEYNHVCHDK